MNSVADWLVENREKIEKGVDIMGQASEVLAATVGQLHPILEAVFMASAELLQDPDSKESRYLTQQFEKVNEKLVGIQSEIDQIAKALEKASLNKQNFDQEAQMLSQYEKFQDFVNAKPKFKEKKKEKFISHYENTDRDLNLDVLYNSIMGENLSGCPLLEKVVDINERDRRAVEDFCAQLKKLFVVGIIAVMGYTALTDGWVGEDIVKKWQQRMENVEMKMKAAVDDCTENFTKQAKEDIEAHFLKNPNITSAEITKALLELLVKKYDWVRWSIRVFNDRERIFFFNWLAGKKYHGSGGANWFDFLTGNKIKVVISFCVDPKPINKVRIQELVEQQKLKGNMMAVALALHKDFPDCLVHAVSHYKMVEQANNFPEDCYYFGKHKRAYLCIHSE
ncbi:rapunzel 5 [Nothobranchius furzeri]|uniref:LOC107379131-like protein n=4 Tax=Nothobranchius TaxID=28779 RepID=A0A1A8A485_NOTFU|nr:rapunzel 5 [Nothobranchius furzeri]KAF7226548.1 putative LOC107379131-like protein [Nothobranchius furzeri]